MGTMSLATTVAAPTGAAHALPAARPRAILTVDLEEWFHVCRVPALEDRTQWEALPSRVETDGLRVLRLLRQYGARATFFVLGWVTERYPDLIRRIAAEGHEVACHGDSHLPLSRLGPRRFRAEVAAGRDALEALTQRPVMGYRAPEWSLTRDTLWALEILKDEGYLYDSSVVPLSGMGDRAFPPGPHRVRTERGPLLEIPATTFRLFWERIPFAGGVPLRLSPDWFVRYEFRAAMDRHGVAVAYLHPWELDPCPPRFPMPWNRRFVHAFRIRSVGRKIELLLAEFPFVSFAEALELGRPVSCSDRMAGARDRTPPDRRLGDRSARITRGVEKRGGRRAVG